MLNVRYSGEAFEIFVNPSSKDLKEIGFRYRFLVDLETKKVYIFNHNLLHDYAYNTLVKEGYIKRKHDYWNREDIIPGYAERKGAKAHVDRGTLDYVTLDHYDYDFKWVDKYIQGFSRLLIDYEEELKRDMERYN